MAYHADDTFLPSWGSGMRPREPVDPNEEFYSGFDEYPPKPMKQGMLANPMTHQMDQLTTYDAEPVISHGCIPVDQPAYGAITEKATEKAAIFRRVDGVRTTQKALFLMWWPAFLGLCVTASFGLGYWHHWLIAHEVLLVSLLIGFSMIWVGLQGGWPGRMSMTFMTVNGCCIIFMVLVGALLGGICFQTYTKTYEIYRGSQSYNNVVPGIDPGAHRDAGIIEFAAGSYVDAEHSIGLRNGDLYCVAPIMHPNSNSYSGFWAAGINCCTGKGTFHCGEDPTKSNQARSGLVVLDENYFGEPEIPEYTMAAQQASSQFNLKMPKEPIFVRWSNDPSLEKDENLHDAFMFVIYSAGGLFGFMLVVAASIAYLGTGHGVGFAHSYFSVQVYDDGEDDYPRRVKRGRKANSNNRYPDNFNL